MLTYADGAGTRQQVWVNDSNCDAAADDDDDHLSSASVSASHTTHVLSLQERQVLSLLALLAQKYKD
jgi:hypothetical protein